MLSNCYLVCESIRLVMMFWGLPFLRSCACRFVVFIRLSVT